MRNTLIVSLLLNSVLAGLLGYIVLRMGGVKYVLFRLGHSESGLYMHRVSHFKKLPAQPNAIVFLGDSQIEQCEWRELISAQSPVINRGITGDQVAGVLTRVGEISRHQPSKVFICVGINDLLFGKPYEDIEKTYYEIIKKLRSENKSAQLCIISVLPVNNTVRNTGIDNQQIIELNIRIQQLARSFAIPYVDLYSKLTDQDGNLSPLFTKDGLHLNADGYLMWKKAIESFL
jgi:lysophospholipase L1-like esterase